MGHSTSVQRSRSALVARPVRYERADQLHARHAAAVLPAVSVGRGVPVPEIDGREGVIGKRGRGLDSAARAYRLGDRYARLKEWAGTIRAALMGTTDRSMSWPFPMRSSSPIALTPSVETRPGPPFSNTSRRCRMAAGAIPPSPMSAPSSTKSLPRGKHWQHDQTAVLLGYRCCRTRGRRKRNAWPTRSLEIASRFHQIRAASW